MSQKKVSQILDIKYNGFLDYLESLPEESRENARNRYASMAVRIWYDAEGADGYHKRSEREKTISLIQGFFLDDSLFPTKMYTPEKRKVILKDLIDSDSISLSMKDVSFYLKSMPTSIRYSFFHDACYLIAVDRQVATKEVHYLKELGKLFEIPEEILKKEFLSFWIDQK